MITQGDPEYDNLALMSQTVLRDAYRDAYWYARGQIDSGAYADNPAVTNGCHNEFADHFQNKVYDFIVSSNVNWDSIEDEWKRFVSGEDSDGV